MSVLDNFNLIEKLLLNTPGGGIHWEKTGSPGNFQVSITNYILTIKKYSEEQDPDCSLRIDNSDGDLVEEITYSDFTELRTKSNKPGQSVLYDLHDAARHSAMRSDKAVKEITTALDELPEPF